MTARLQLLARTGHPDFLDLPWDRPLAEWESERLVEVTRGIHRHVVRFVEYSGAIYALKELLRGDDLERRREREERRVQAPVRLLAERALELRVVDAAGEQAAERHGVQAFALLPPVVAGLAPEEAQTAAHAVRRVVPARVSAALGVPAERPQPEPPAVPLPHRPLARVVGAVEPVARAQLAAAGDDASDPVEEALSALVLPDEAHRVPDERSVAQPRVAVLRERGRGDVAALRRLAGADRSDARRAEVSDARCAHGGRRRRRGRAGCRGARARSSSGRRRRSRRGSGRPSRRGASP